MKMKSILAAALACAVASACSYRGFYVKQGEQTYEVGAPAESPRADADLYEAAFQLCRDKHNAGYVIRRAPTFDRHGNLVATFACEGPVDPDLVAKFARRAPIREENPNSNGATLNYGGGFF